MVEIIDYNIYTTPFKELPCLEDAIQKSYSTDDEQNKTMSITIREYPVSIPYGIESLIEDGLSNYFSVIERHAIYYAVSITQAKVQEIVKTCRRISKQGSIMDNDLLLYNSGGIPFKTRTKQEMSHISMPYWCKEWINSNHRYLNLSAGKVATFLLMLALSKSTIYNPEVKKDIDIEAEWFNNFLNYRLTSISKE